MTHPTEQAINAAAKALDPDAWNLSPQQFTEQEGGYPAWSSDSQDGRKEWSLKVAAEVLNAALPHIRTQLAIDIRYKIHTDGYSQDPTGDWTLGMGCAANLVEGKP